VKSSIKSEDCQRSGRSRKPHFWRQVFRIFTLNNKIHPKINASCIFFTVVCITFSWKNSKLSATTWVQRGFHLPDRSTSPPRNRILVGCYTLVNNQCCGFGSGSGRIRNNCNRSGSDLYAKKICIIFENLSSK
jgi:hypothetical protein